MSDIIKECDMYQPIKEFFLEQGFDVKGEVKDCDIVAEKDGQVLVIEMKKQFNLKLLLQGALRQRFADCVYVAIEKPKKSQFTKEWNDKKYLLRRLEMGLIFVNNNKIEVVLDAKEFDIGKMKNRNKKKKDSVLIELKKRSGDFNKGGTTGKKIVTAYREEAIKLAHIISEQELSIKEIISKGGSKKTSSILQKNFYQWFIRVKRGTYKLTDKGQDALVTYNGILNQIDSKIDHLESKEIEIKGEIL